MDRFVTSQHAFDAKVSSRGQMSLPAAVRRRWDLDDGGTVAVLDLGDVVVLAPGGMRSLRRELFGQITDETWAEAQRGFGDADLANV